MPKYRKLWVKATESLDINEMPDDFTRLLWVLLPLGLDREGRGQDNLAWIKARIMPLREDVTQDRIAQAFAWYEGRGMIVRYCGSGRRYFWVPTFAHYQGDTNKEAASEYPSPPVQSNSGVSRELVPTEFVQHAYTCASESESTRARGTIDPIEHALAMKAQGLHPGIGEPGEEQYWQYRDEALKVYEQETGARLVPAGKDAILALVAADGFSPERWIRSVKSCVAAGVRTGNVTCMVQTYQEADGDYSVLVKRGKGNSRGNGADTGPPDWIDKDAAALASGKKKIIKAAFIGGDDD